MTETELAAAAQAIELLHTYRLHHRPDLTDLTARVQPAACEYARAAAPHIAAYKDTIIAGLRQQRDQLEADLHMTRAQFAETRAIADLLPDVTT